VGGGLVPRSAGGSRAPAADCLGIGKLLLGDGLDCGLLGAANHGLPAKGTARAAVATPAQALVRQGVLQAQAGMAEGAGPIAAPGWADEGAQGLAWVGDVGWLGCAGRAVRPSKSHTLKKSSLLRPSVKWPSLPRLGTSAAAAALAVGAVSVS